MTMCTRALLVTGMLLAGCAATPPITVVHRVPSGSTIAVVMFSDCQIANQTDCVGSGVKAASIFVHVLAQRPGLHTISLPRPVAPGTAFTDDAAVAYGKSKGYRYVMNGEVQDYYHTGHLAIHADRAAVSLRVLNTSNGQAVATYTYQGNSKTHFTSPDDMVEDMAKQLGTSVSAESKKQKQGNFMFYKGNGAG